MISVLYLLNNRPVLSVVNQLMLRSSFVGKKKKKPFEPEKLIMFLHTKG